MRSRNSSGPPRGRRNSPGQSRPPGKKKFSSAASKGAPKESADKKKFSKTDQKQPDRKFSKRPPAEKKSGYPVKKFSKRSEQESTAPKFKRRAEGSGVQGDFKRKPYRPKPASGISRKDEATTINRLTGKIRLNRYIANSGICSRREADELIKMGLVSVNGKVITEMGFQVNPGDEVRYENKVLRAEKPVYILMNKPKGYLTTTKDPQERNTVMHIIGGSVKERLYPVGRLDRNTTGLLLFTNDGDLADKLSHPSYNVKKIYKVELNRALTKSDFQKILEGVHLEEGRAIVDDLAIISEDGKTVGLELHIGWNRVVRRIFEKLEYEVVKLDRSVYAGLDKKDLPRGHWRFLTKEEIVRLKHFGKQ
jgi:23S rRNA pseudouridine2605 synthase